MNWGYLAETKHSNLEYTSYSNMEDHMAGKSIRGKVKC
jgi:hypothetical protein